MTEKVLRLPQVEKITGLARSTVYRLIEQGRFPKQIHLSTRAVGWLESDVHAWIKERTEHSQS